MIKTIIVSLILMSAVSCVKKDFKLEETLEETKSVDTIKVDTLLIETDSL